MQPLNVKDVVSVYEGEAGNCCCGCAGEYYHNPVLAERIAEYVEEHLIYQPKPEQFNQDKIAAITALVNKGIECGETEFWGRGLYSLKVLDQQYYVRTTAEYEVVRRIKSGVAAKKSEPTAPNEANA